ncbi:hypothetical protein D8911_03910 [Levilactobacillus brevis]|nr:hypothetical protein D8911_03910 [Levilactobacillus brevis]
MWIIIFRINSVVQLLNDGRRGLGHRRPPKIVVGGDDQIENDEEGKSRIIGKIEIFEKKSIIIEKTIK